MGKVIVRGPEAREKVLQIVRDGGTLEEAAASTGYGQDYCRQLCTKHGVLQTNRIKPEEVERMRAMAEGGATIDEIAEEFRWSSRTIQTRLWKIGVKAKRKKAEPNTEIQERNRSMREYKAAGHTLTEVAEKFGLSQNYAKHICRGATDSKKYWNGKVDREQNALRYIEERAPGFEYVGGFTDLDGFVDLRCKACGSVMHKSFVSVRHGGATCSICKERERENLKLEKKAAKEAERLQRKEQKQLDRRRNMKFVQISMKQCPVCAGVFVGAKTYCSEKCRNQSHYAMKDGYRYLFPLSEVYERDNGICYLCGEPCDWNDYEVVDGVKVCGNRYPSRDHVVPKSKGGANTWENIRLAHRICNSRKRARVI